MLIHLFMKCLFVQGFFEYEPARRQRALPFLFLHTLVPADVHLQFHSSDSISTHLM